MNVVLIATLTRLYRKSGPVIPMEMYTQYLAESSVWNTAATASRLSTGATSAQRGPSSSAVTGTAAPMRTRAPPRSCSRAPPARRARSPSTGSRFLEPRQHRHGDVADRRAQLVRGVHDELEGAVVDAELRCAEPDADDDGVDVVADVRHHLGGDHVPPEPENPPTSAPRSGRPGSQPAKTATSTSVANAEPATGRRAPRVPPQ